MTIFARAFFAAALGALVLAVPAASQSRSEEEAEHNAEVARMAADPALSEAANAAFLANNLKQQGVLHRPSGLQYKILQNGFGGHPGGADTVEVYYTGKLINGKVFDGTSPGLPASLKLNSVIPGWIEALQLMREGDHWLLTIPPNLGYGSRSMGDGAIPPNQVLVFDIKLVSTTPAAKRGEKGYVPDPSDKEDQQ
jgi:peptidylprolyl isomerase/FKBP-type peptidyl-prolyl cis-trans isomerase FklB